MTVPEIIKKIRKDLELNQMQLAQLIWPDRDPKVTQTYISKYEIGKADPPASIFLRIQELSKQA